MLLLIFDCILYIKKFKNILTQICSVEQASSFDFLTYPQHWLYWFDFSVPKHISFLACTFNPQAWNQHFSRVLILFRSQNLHSRYDNCCWTVITFRLFWWLEKNGHTHTHFWDFTSNYEIVLMPPIQIHPRGFSHLYVSFIFLSHNEYSDFQWFQK